MTDVGCSGFLDAETPEGTRALDVSSILYVEDMGAERRIHTVGAAYPERRTLPELIRLLPRDFILSDLHHLVNLRHVIRLERDGFRMTGNVCIPVAPFFDGNTRVQLCRWIALQNWENEPTE